LLVKTNKLDANLIVMDDNLPTTGLVYTNSWDSNAVSFVDGTKAMAQATVGCLDGSVSGLRCNVMRDGTQVRDEQYCEYLCAWIKVFRVNTLNGTQIVAEGDSGGPVVQYKNDNTYGLGTITSGANSIPCDSYTDPEARDCYTSADLTPINRVTKVLAPHGIYIQ
jgi:hypothetical protein